jgi:iron-regulated transporter 1
MYSLLSPIVKYWESFATCGCAGAMIAYSFLFLTVLSFGSLMTVYLQWAGMSEEAIGVSRGLAALTGFAGALSYPSLRARLGLWRAAELSIVFQSSLVALAAASFFWVGPPNDQAIWRVQVGMWVLVVAVLVSRAGLWVFDLCVRQIAQETIPESVRGRVNGQWRAMVAFFEMASFLVAMRLSDPNCFWQLSVISAGMVAAAMVLFCATRPKGLKGGELGFEGDEEG